MQQAYIDFHRAHGDKLRAATDAGFADPRRAVGKLDSTPHVRAETDKHDAVAAELAAVTPARILTEYARIAFADIRDIVQVAGGKVTITDTADLTDAQAAAIESIQQTKDGGIRIKLASKIAALDALAARVLKDDDDGLRDVTPQRAGLTDAQAAAIEEFIGVDPRAVGGLNGTH